VKITDLIKELEKAKNLIGDVEVCTTGYYATIVVDEVQMSSWGENGRFLDNNGEVPDQTKIAVLLPGNFP
jgi:hypothetical protein